jgi:hypothetical protein
LGGTIGYIEGPVEIVDNIFENVTTTFKPRRQAGFIACYIHGREDTITPDDVTLMTRAEQEIVAGLLVAPKRDS